MSNELISISRSDLVAFAKRIYSRGVNGYLDLEDSTCLSETQRLFDEFLIKKDLHLKGLQPLYTTTTSDLTLSNNLAPHPGLNSWVVSSFNPYFSAPPVNLNSISLVTESTPSERQLTFFEGQDSIIEDETSNDFDSNEGHVSFNS
jgi:hypothetical protein